MNQPKIVMYVRRHCSDVDLARRILTERELEWDEVDIDRDAEGLVKVMEWNDGRSPTPTLWIGNTMLVEPSAEEIDEAIAVESGGSPEDYRQEV